MKNNKDIPLRVRLSPAEDARIRQAAARLGLTKSVYVRWALANSTEQVLGPPQYTASTSATAIYRLRQLDLK